MSSNYRIIGSKIKSVHAEDACLSALERLFQFKKYRKRVKFNLLVIRLNRNGNLKISRPCARCIKRIARSPLVGMINGIYYSNSIGNISFEKTSDMIDIGSDFITLGDLHYRQKFKSKVSRSCSRRTKSF